MLSCDLGSQRVQRAATAESAGELRTPTGRTRSRRLIEATRATIQALRGVAVDEFKVPCAEVVKAGRRDLDALGRAGRTRR
ncbi:MAG: hypothetical protein ACLTSX_03450 [Collinsella sp.]